MRYISLLSLSVCLAVLSGCQQAANTEAELAQPALAGTETSKDFGDYVVHFNALSTEQLSPDVARQYDIVRSGNRALLNVSIIKKVPGALGTSVSGSVSASAVNLTGQLKNITIREIREEQAIYYIGEAMISNEETLIFTIDATPRQFLICP